MQKFMNIERMKKMRKKILIIIGRYYPGFRDGGPVQSMMNLVSTYGEEFDFHILTQDRDQGDHLPYPNVTINQWIDVFGAHVFYASPRMFNTRTIRRIMTDMDLIYVCGLFSPYTYQSLLANSLSKHKKKIVIAMMGSLSPGALSIKKSKKSFFLGLSNMLRLYKHAYFSATSMIESEEIKKQLTTYQKIYIAEDLPKKYPTQPNFARSSNRALSVVFISRIARMKNLKFAIEVLKKVSVPVEFNIYGFMEDESYWNECLLLLNTLNNSVTWTYHGGLLPHNVYDVFSKHDVFLFPTHGENYGHVIYESLASGCIPVISDRTPWTDLEAKKSGFIIPLEQEDRYVEVLNQLATSDDTQLSNLKLNAHRYAVQKYHDSVDHSGYLSMFHDLLGEH